MASLRERLERWSAQFFPWAWRLAVLVLPWQTRWFQEGPTIAGYPWEQGRISIYASWFLLLFVAVLDLVLRKKEHRPAIKSTWICGLTALFVAFTFITTASLRSTFEWWLEVVVLILFVRAVFSRVTLRDFSWWFALSLVPHALLGLWQSIDQSVVGYSLLGMASQDPRTPGVAVIEVIGVRWLRAYGGFPHPNIFGGWLVIGIISLVMLLKERMIKIWQKYVIFAFVTLFSLALACTYSRSAWIALVVGCITMGISCIGFSKESFQRNWKRLALAFVLILVSFGSVFFLRPNLVMSRAQTTTRLEQKSVSERKQGIENALRILRERPLTGSGLGASALVVQRLDRAEQKPAIIPVPPHMVPLLGVAELGLVGTGILMAILLLSAKLFKLRFQQLAFSEKIANLALCFTLVPILVLDHYLWSYWSGKILFLLFGWIAVKADKT